MKPVCCCLSLDLLGLRVSVVLAALFETVGSGLRIINAGAASMTWFIHLGQFITGLGGPVAMAAAPLVSSAWFPPDQRTTATAISSLACYSGTALSFVIGPLLVPDVPRPNGTDYAAIRSNMTQGHINCLKSKIMNLMYFEFGFTAFIFLLVLLYFPAKPRLPPSVTAAIGRLEFMSGAKILLKKPQFWLLVSIYGISTGVYGGWCSILDLNLAQFGIDQKTAGWLGFGAVVAGSVSGISLSMWVISHYHYSITLCSVFGKLACWAGCRYIVSCCV